MRVLIATFALLSMLIAGAVVAKVEVATLRGSTELTEQGKPPMMAPVVNEDVKLQRAYPMQPPIIPHKIDGYQVDLNSNKCLSCHSRKRTAESQAPMVSVTHFMDRDGNFLADVSPRRYFCQQCHVTQDKVKPLIENDFKDVDLVLKEKSAGQVK
ncbi:nitrate reductase cytochrome c-type subunit [Corallincola spongiicola]|uniref:Periplasmic nitrate reductase, electron transfer subunit n=1 Tax=Corallincola spongiicola TaxID=2520508 RepID=A0ABY1WR30_9GAMM|nr:nitrate reductase cytochrome c-type subunit [Corallincola spongiicola]TAA47186.1 nitrate reductase cytochrome c-type subunit [Corallincola spongiicola]